VDPADEIYARILFNGESNRFMRCREWPITRSSSTASEELGDDRVALG